MKSKSTIRTVRLPDDVDRAILRKMARTGKTRTEIIVKAIQRRKA
jgi:predicted transcriptional regulator